eukprot:1795797-Pleurochrysis_carterae.AAC.1
MAAAFGASQLSEDGSAGVGCAPTWATSRPRRKGRHSSWRTSSARLWPTGRWPTPTRAALLQAPSSIVWQGYPPYMVWYEPGENLGSELIREFELSLSADAAADEASAREDAELIDLEESKRMPAA